MKAYELKPWFTEGLCVCVCVKHTGGRGLDTILRQVYVVTKSSTIQTQSKNKRRTSKVQIIVNCRLSKEEKSVKKSQVKQRT